MIRASALYIVIVIALVIGLLCASVVALSYYYREQSNKKLRYDLLENNLISAQNILLSKISSAEINDRMSLFGGDQDSVTLQKYNWGAYDIGVTRSFAGRDTMSRIFSFANQIDSTQFPAIYLADDSRSLSVSGNTLIEGIAYLPKSGIKAEYIDNTPYSGNRELVSGTRKASASLLPGLNQLRLDQLNQLTQSAPNVPGQQLPIRIDSLSNSFRLPVKVISAAKTAFYLQGTISGHILIRSDRTITIDSLCKLTNVIVCAHTIIVKSGFQGTCQLFATDSIHIGKNCVFNYPSVVGIHHTNPSTTRLPAKVTIETGTILNGTLFTSDINAIIVPPIIDLKTGTQFVGQIYSQGVLNCQKNITVFGSIFTSRFSYQTASTRVENCLLNMVINTRKLSPYFLTTDLLPMQSGRNQVLQWLK
jgi:hypothetical protein